MSMSLRVATTSATMRLPLMSIRRLAAAAHPSRPGAPLRRAVQSSASSTTTATDGPSTSARPAPPTWDLRLLYDGDCPLCMREVDMLRRRDAGAGRIDFVDIADPDYRAEDNSGVTFEQAMERIHAILPDGTVVKDVEVFRRAYEAVGLGWVYAITKFEPALVAANKLYDVWAKYRLPITGRPDLAVVLQEKKMCRAASKGKSSGQAGGQ